MSFTPSKRTALHTAVDHLPEEFLGVALRTLSRLCHPVDCVEVAIAVQQANGAVNRPQVGLAVQWLMDHSAGHDKTMTWLPMAVEGNNLPSAEISYIDLDSTFEVEGLQEIILGRRRNPNSAITATEVVKVLQGIPNLPLKGGQGCCNVFLMMGRDSNIYQLIVTLTTQGIVVRFKHHETAFGTGTRVFGFREIIAAYSRAPRP